MLVLIRTLLVIALAVVTVAPHQVHAAPASTHHATHVGHGHGQERHEDSGHEHPGSTGCCASLSVQCGVAGLAEGGDSTPAARLIAETRNRYDRGARGAGAVPGLEPPPPRA